MAETTPEHDAGDARRDRRIATALMALLVVLYLGFLVLYVPRLNNYVLSDREFTGWSGPIAERLLGNGRPYVDFVLPIPPGSLALLAAIQRICGRPLLLQELWVAALSHLSMGLLAYAIARQFASRKVATLVAFSTLVLVAQTPKECAYDHTSLLCAWGSILAGAMAARSPEAERRRNLWFATGLLSTTALWFKQSTAVGAIAGWAFAFAYLVWVETRARRKDEVLARLRDAAACIAGGAAGFFLVTLLLLAERIPLRAFVQAVLIDGPSLKGGTRSLLLNLFNFTVRIDATRNAIVPMALVTVVALGIVRRRGTLHVGDGDRSRPSLGIRDAIGIGALAVLVFGSAAALLGFEVRALDHLIVGNVEALKNIPPYGYVFGILFFFSHLDEKNAKTETERRTGHALNAVLVSSAVSSLIYDTSFIQFSPFYYNDPSIPVILLCFFVATERSGARWATPVAILVSVLPLFGTKLDRALSADVPVTEGQWAGLRVNYRGVEILKATRRAEELAGENGTVLVLPEDLELAGLIQRPRPPVLGAVLFVDQYPKRLLAHDLRAIDEHPPDVIVIHPRRLEGWHTLFHTWTFDSGAERLMNHVLSKLLPKDYVLDSTYPTIYFVEPGQLDVYVRKHGDGS